MAAAPKKARKGSPAAASPRVVTAGGEPVGRFAQVLAETREAGLAIEPFEITDDLVLYPPNRFRQRQIDDSSQAYIFARSVAIELMKVRAPDFEDAAEMTRWVETQKNALAEANKLASEAELSYNEALFGGPEAYQRVQEFFADRPEWEHRAFENALNEQFRQLPKDGICQACGQVVDQREGESEGESSGSSSTTGTSSTTTSPSRSESTPGTGSEEPDPGPSSSTTPSE